MRVVRVMLNTPAPADPVLLLAVIDGCFTDLPRNVHVTTNLEPTPSVFWKRGVSCYAPSY
jgi:hypothetical protein